MTADYLEFDFWPTKVEFKMLMFSILFWIDLGDVPCWLEYFRGIIYCHTQLWYCCEFAIMNTFSNFNLFKNLNQILEELSKVSRYTVSILILIFFGTTKNHCIWATKTLSFPGNKNLMGGPKSRPCRKSHLKFEPWRSYTLVFCPQETVAITKVTWQNPGPEVKK